MPLRHVMILQRGRCRRWRFAFPVFTAVALAFLLATPAATHDVPDEILIHAFVKPEGGRLHFLLRLPLQMLLNMHLPKRGPGYLDLAYMEEPLEASARAAARELELYENDSRLRVSETTAELSLPSNQSFASYEEALAHIHGPPLPETTQIFWDQGFVDMHLEYPITSERSRFSYRLGLGAGLGDGLHTILRFVSPDGTVRAYDVIGTTDRIALDPRWHQAALLFVRSGFFHILDGIDHLLFLFCLVIPFRRLREFILVVTAFTVAHSITLIASAYQAAPSAPWFPALVETLIAVSIVYMALENIVAASLRRRWLITFVFGLVHGFGFSFALRKTLQFAGSHLLLSLLSFNVGVELGQIVVLLLLIPAIEALFRHVMPERMGIIILSAFAAHTGWHWMTERGAELGRYEWSLPSAGSILSLAPWVLAILLAGGALWLLVGWLRGTASRAATTD